MKTEQRRSELSIAANAQLSHTITSSPAGRSIVVDGSPCVTPCAVSWYQGSLHTIAATTQSDATTRYLFVNWSDGGGASHTVTPAVSTTYAATFNTQYYLTTAVNPAGSGSITLNPNASPPWYNAGTQVTLTASSTPVTWSGDASGTSISVMVAMNGPKSVTANYSQGGGGCNPYSGPSPSWYNTAWSKRKALTVTCAEVTGFPLSFSITDNDIKTAARADGYDILFTDASGNKLNHQIERYNSGTGEVVAWVKTDLSASTQTRLYVYYGNPSAANQENAAVVWDANYRGVWHFASGALGVDSMGVHAAASGTLPTATTAGRLGGGASFNGSSSQYLQIAHVNPAVSGSFTVEAWGQPSDTQARSLVSSRTNTSDASFDYKFMNGSVIHGDIGNGSTWLTTAADAAYAYSPGTWYHVAYVVTPSDYKIYVDGVQRGSGTLGGNALLYDASHLLKIGYSGWPDPYSEWFSGVIDEVRVSSTARSAAWMDAQHKNQVNAGNAFYSTGAQEVMTGPLVSHTITSSPAGRSIVVDGSPCVTPCPVSWYQSSPHTIAATTQGDATTQYVFVNWSDGGGASHTVTPAVSTTYTATFNTQYYLTTAVNPAGSGSITLNPSASPPWYNAGTQVTLTASSTPVTWSGDASGTGISVMVAMNGPKSVTANYSQGGGGCNPYSGTSPSWYNTAWSKRKALTVTCAEVTGFPLSFSVTDNDIKTAAREDGHDILFTDASGAKLNHQIERYNPGTGELVAWVKTDLSASTQTRLFVYYGNPSAANQENAAGVWDANYRGVWHFASGALGVDSTGVHAAASGTLPTATTAGRLGGGASFNGSSSQYLQIAHVNPAVSGSFTVEAWGQPSDTQARSLVSSRTNTSDASFDYKFMNGSVIHGDIGNGSTWLTTAADAAYAYSPGTWYLVAYVVTPSDYKIYVDGVQRGSGTLGGNALLYDASHLLKIGYSGWPDPYSEWFSGVIDEVRVSSTARSGAWMDAQYRNQVNAGNTFYSTGGQEGMTVPITHTFHSSPAGLTLQVDATVCYTSPPCTRQWVAGTAHGLTAPSYSDIGYSFQNWTVGAPYSSGGTIVSTSAIRTVNPAPSVATTYYANYSSGGTGPYPLTTQVSPLGAGTVTPSGGMYSAQTEVQLTAWPAAGHQLLSWSGVDRSSGTTAWVTMNGPRTVTPNFTTATGNVSCSASPNPATTGTPVTLTAEVSGISQPSYAWSGAVTGSQSSVSFTPTQPGGYLAKVNVSGLTASCFVAVAEPALVTFRSCIGSGGTGTCQLPPGVHIVPPQYGSRSHGAGPITAPYLSIARPDFTIAGTLVSGPADTVLRRGRWYTGSEPMPWPHVDPAMGFEFVMQAAGSATNVTIRDMLIDGNRYAPGLNCTPGNAGYHDLGLSGGGKFTLESLQFINAPGTAVHMSGNGSSISLSTFGHGYTPPAGVSEPTLSQEQTATRSTAIFLEGANNAALFNSIHFAGTAGINLSGTNQWAYGNTLFHNRYEISDGSGGGQLYLEGGSANAIVAGNVVYGGQWPPAGNIPAATECMLPFERQYNAGVEAYGFDHSFFNNEVADHSGTGMQFAGSNATGRITISSVPYFSEDTTHRFIEGNGNAGIIILGKDWCDNSDPPVPAADCRIAVGVTLDSVFVSKNQSVSLSLDLNEDTSINSRVMDRENPPAAARFTGFFNGSCIRENVNGSGDPADTPLFGEQLSRRLPSSMTSYVPPGASTPQTCPVPPWPTSIPPPGPYRPGWPW